MLVDNGNGNGSVADEMRWRDVYQLLRRPGPLQGFDFEPLDNNVSLAERLHDFKILVVGAGGLGCELLKDLAMMGFLQIDVVDMDTVEFSNLNRQFLFRPSDVGRPKAEVAAAYVNKRITGVRVTPHVCRLESLPPHFYKQFKLIVSGLDSVQARRSLNFFLCELVEKDIAGDIDPSSVIPFIDGGTEGFKGHARMVLPHISACFECAIDMFPPQTKYPVCTVASEPRLPEHCIQWAAEVAWSSPEVSKPWPSGTSLDTDNMRHMQWVFETAFERAEERNISGVTISLTLGVVKNIIPAIAASNAVVAAICANEAFKYATSVSQSLDNYIMYNGAHATFSFTYEHQRNPNCLVCGKRELIFVLKSTTTLSDLIELLRNDSRLQFANPSLRLPNRNLYMQNPPALEESTRCNLPLSLQDLGVCNGAVVTVTDRSLDISLALTIRYE